MGSVNYLLNSISRISITNEGQLQLRNLRRPALIQGKSIKRGKIHMVSGLVKIETFLSKQRLRGSMYFLLVS
jgi:hypothetical protein